MSNLYLVVDGKVLYRSERGFVNLNVNLNEYYITAFFLGSVGPRTENVYQRQWGYLFLTNEKDLYSVVFDENNRRDYKIIKLFSNIAHVGSTDDYLVCVDTNGKIVTDDDEFPGSPENVFFVKAAMVKKLGSTRRGIVAIDSEGNLWAWGDNTDRKYYLGFNESIFFSELTKITEDYIFVDILVCKQTKSPYYELSVTLLDYEGKLYMFGCFTDIYPVSTNDEDLYNKYFWLRQVEFPEKISKIFFSNESLIIYTENGNLYADPDTFYWFKTIVKKNRDKNNYFGFFYRIPIDFIPEAFHVEDVGGWGSFVRDSYVAYIREINKNLYKIDLGGDIMVDPYLKVDLLGGENPPLFSNRFYSIKSARK